MQELPWERLQIAIGAVANMQVDIERTLAYVKGARPSARRSRRSRTRASRSPNCRPGPGGAGVRRPLHRTAPQGELDTRDRVDGQVLDHRPRVPGDRQIPATHCSDGYGYVGYPIARQFADSRVQRICGGTNEIMKEVIARSMGLRWGLPSMDMSLAPQAISARADGRARTLDERDEGQSSAQLLTTAARLFRRQGFDATSTRDIAAAAGMHAGSPFYHFKARGALLSAVMEEGMRAALARQESALRGGAKPAATCSSSGPTSTRCTGRGATSSGDALRVARAQAPANAPASHGFSAATEVAWMPSLRHWPPTAG